MSASSSSRPETLAGPAHWALLVGAGAAAALLHEAFRWPLNLPGHHGLEWLAILMAARLCTRRPGAALAVSLGAAAMAVALGGGGHGGALRPLVYLLQGVALDALWTLWASRDGSLRTWQAGVLGAVVHAMSPLAKLAFVGAGAGMQAVAAGLASPLLSHAAFGAVGAVLGAAGVAAWRRRARRLD